MSESHTDLLENLDEPEAIQSELDESTGAESSPAESGQKDDSQDGRQDEKEPTIDEYELARDALGEKSSDSESNREQEGDSESAKKEGADDEEDLPDEISDEELAGYKPKTQRRMKQLLGKVKEGEDKIADLEPAATEYRKIESYLQNNGVSYETAGDAIELAALMTNDPKTAYERLVPIMQDLATKVGAVIPDDLRQKVEQGYITEQDAREMARLRAGQTLSEQQVEAERQRNEQANQRALVQQMQDAYQNWEANAASSDPDFEMKRARVQEKVELALSRGRQNGTLPKSVDDLIKLANDAKSEVDGELKSFTKKPAINPLDGGTSGPADAPPKNEYEAAARALAQ